MKTLFCSILALISITASASTQDVRPETFVTGSRYVRVSVLPDHFVRFEDCIKGSEATSCKQIGPKNAYSHDELTSQKTWEQVKTVGAGAGDAIAMALLVGTGAGVGFAGGYIGGALICQTGVISYAAADGFMFTLGLIGVGAGGYGMERLGSALAHSVDAINPYEQYKRTETLSDTVINDQPVQEQDIGLFIERLSIVLGDI